MTVERMTVIKLILNRFIQKFGSTSLTWVIGPIFFIVILHLALLIVVSVECWVSGKVTFGPRIAGNLHTWVCPTH